MHGQLYPDHAHGWDFLAVSSPPFAQPSHDRRYDQDLIFLTQREVNLVWLVCLSLFFRNEP
jgi:hypothetical protein